MTNHTTSRPDRAHRDMTMILPYTPSDKEDVLSIWRQASAIAHPFLAETTVAQAEAMIRDQLLDMAETWMARRDGRNVGFVALIGDEVGGLFILPSQQGRGLGRALLDKAASVHSALTLSVFAENPKAQGFYQAYGFVETGRQTSDFFGHEEIRMRFERP